VKLAPHERILVALDTTDLNAAAALARDLRGLVGGFKVGLEICTAHGPQRVIETIAAFGMPIFLDLKLHDIPNTVAGAVRAVLGLGESVRFLTLHTQGGRAMLQAAVAAAAGSAARPALIGVTVLTSLDQQALHDELGVAADLATHVGRLAALAALAGLDGVVASPLEIATIRAAQPQLTIITPGIRPHWAAGDDQQRVMTPGAALAAGADYLVIGRPITRPPAAVGTSAAAAELIAAELSAATGS
jgi:orotidine-5'-phosphate decarboxylase